MITKYLKIMDSQAIVQLKSSLFPDPYVKKNDSVVYFGQLKLMPNRQDIVFLKPIDQPTGVLYEFPIDSLIDVEQTSNRSNNSGQVEQIYRLVVKKKTLAVKWERFEV